MNDTNDQEKSRKDRVRADQELGMNRGITRRDFVNGVAVGIGALTLPDLATALDQASKPAVSKGQPGGAEFAPEKAPDYYPPAKTGMRGDRKSVV